MQFWRFLTPAGVPWLLRTGAQLALESVQTGGRDASANREMA